MSLSPHPGTCGTDGARRPSGRKGCQGEWRPVHPRAPQTPSPPEASTRLGQDQSFPPGEMEPSPEGCHCLSSCPQGQPGTEGPPGKTGPVGAQGPPGRPGSEGLRGIPGPAVSRGLRGSWGLRGGRSCADVGLPVSPKPPPAAAGGHPRRHRGCSLAGCGLEECFGGGSASGSCPTPSFFQGEQGLLGAPGQAGPPGPLVSHAERALGTGDPSWGRSGVRDTLVASFRVPWVCLASRETPATREIR